MKFFIQEDQSSFHMTSLRGDSKGGKSKTAVSYNTAHRSGCKVTAVRKMWLASKHASLHWD